MHTILIASIWRVFKLPVVMLHCIVVEIVILTILKENTFLEFSFPYPQYFIFPRELKNQQKDSGWIFRSWNANWVFMCLSIKNLIDQAVLNPFIGLSIHYTKLCLWSVYQGLTRTNLRDFSQSPHSLQASLNVQFFVK